MTVAVVDAECAGLSSQRLARIGPVMQRYVEEGKIAGVSTLLARRGQVIHFEQTGWMDREAARPMRDDALFRIYSMTKPIVCTAAMTLYEQGRFHLFDPLQKYLPAFANVKVLERNPAGNNALVAPSRPITVRDLFLHTAGLTYDFLEESPVSALYREAKLMHSTARTLEQMIDDLARLPLAYHPGSHWHYSLAIDVIAHLIQVLADKPLGDSLQEALFNPLGMQDTGFGVPSAHHDRVATMYGRHDLCGVGVTFSQEMEAWLTQPPVRLDVDATYPTDNTTTFQRGGHGLFSTAQDYFRFAQMLLNHGELDGVRVLGRKTVELMHINHLSTALLPCMITPELPLNGYGFGLGSRVLLDVAASEMPGSVGEFGWSGAAHTYYWVDPQEEMVGVLMTQDMMGFDPLPNDFRILAYQAVID